MIISITTDTKIGKSVLRCNISLILIVSLFNAVEKHSQQFCVAKSAHLIVSTCKS